MTDGEVTLFSWSGSAGSRIHAKRLSRLVTFVGAKAVEVDVDNLPQPDGSQAACAIVDAATLSAWCLSSNTEPHALLAGLGVDVLVYGFEASPGHDALLKSISSGEISAAAPLAGRPPAFHVEGPREACGTFSGLMVDAAHSRHDHAFRFAKSPHLIRTLVRIGDDPFLVSLPCGPSRVTLLACREIADLDEPVPKAEPIAAYFSRIATIAMFLRQALGPHLWHNPTPGACFIVDDPLLRPQYGFLNYKRLLDTIGPRPFSASLAFIPWNHARSEVETVGLFKSRSPGLSICVHGCDHTAREFADTDFAVVCERARRGLDWMERHARRTGLAFDDVMVFPQGHFSVAAMRALQACGYLAAVNSTAYPVDAPGSLRLRDLLDGAVTRFSELPLFTRRYPTDVVGSAFDLFFGKPALVVEHHQYFRAGYGDLATVVDRLNAMDPHLEWSSLSQVCQTACMRRHVTSDQVAVRFFTDRFVFCNRAERPIRYTMTRVQSDVDANAALFLNGRRASPEGEPGTLSADLCLNPGETAEIEIKRATIPVPEPKGRPRRSAVFARRMLSEFRDNHVERSPFLSRLAKRARNLAARRK